LKSSFNVPFVWNFLQVWQSMLESHIHTDKVEQKCADRLFLNLRSLREMHLLVEDIWARLKSFGITNPLPHEQIIWNNSERTIILKIVIAGAFYPNYFIKRPLCDVASERRAYQTLSGCDPCNTVYFSNFNQNQYGPLYNQQIKELFRGIGVDPQNIEVRFPEGTERVFVTFKSNSNENDSSSGFHGSIRKEISKALYMRMIGMRMAIKVME